MKAKSYLSNFWVVVVKKVHILLGYGTLVSAGFWHADTWHAETSES